MPRASTAEAALSSAFLTSSEVPVRSPVSTSTSSARAAALSLAALEAKESLSFSPFNALQLGLEVPDVRVLGGLPLRRAPLIPPGVHQHLDDALFGLLLRAEGGQQQALGGVGLPDLPQGLRREALQGVEGLGWDLLLDGGTKRAPGGGVLRDPARDAPEQRRAAAGLAGQGVGLYSPGKEDLFEAWYVPAELRQGAPGVEPPETPQQQLLGEILRW